MTSFLPRRYKTVPGRYYGTPKELWGFRTAAVRGTPAAIARRFLRDSAETLGITKVRSRLSLKRVIESLGAVHVIFQQGLHGRPIHRAYVTVHVDWTHRVFLAKNRAVPAVRRIFREQGPGQVECNAPLFDCRMAVSQR